MIESTNPKKRDFKSDDYENSSKREDFCISEQEKELQVNLKSNQNIPQLEESLKQRQEQFLQENLYQQKKAQFACMRGEFKKKG